jgi:hypothetical protein
VTVAPSSFVVRVLLRVVCSLLVAVCRPPSDAVSDAALRNISGGVIRRQQNTTKQAHTSLNVASLHIVVCLPTSDVESTGCAVDTVSVRSHRRIDSTLSSNRVQLHHRGTHCTALWTTDTRTRLEHTTQR